MALAVVAAACLLLLAGCDWTMYRGDAAHTGASAGESTIGVANVGGLAQAWTTSDDDAVGNDRGSPVVALGRVYVPTSDSLAAYDAGGVVGCGGTPVECQPVWRTDVAVSYPSVAGSTLYGTYGSQLRAYDATGAVGCAGNPPVCQPLWTGILGADDASPSTIAGGIVYLSAVTSGTDVLLAFDATGEQGCAGDPKECQPLWTATFGTAVPYADGERRSPSVASGRVFVSGSDNAVHVFDAAGQEGCGGSPRQCGELWTAVAPVSCTVADSRFCGLSTPAVAGGRIYVNVATADDTGGVHVFDANGQSSCSGSPKVCSPLWRSSGGGSLQAPAVANGVVLAIGTPGSLPPGPSSPVRLSAFDAAGTQGCSGTPTICAPLWASTSSWISSSGAHTYFGDPVVANGVVYVASITDIEYFGPFGSVIRHVQAFDVAGVQSCTGAPKQCAPVLDITPPRDVMAYTDPVVANGVLYVADIDIKAQPSATIARLVRAYRL